MLAIDYAAKLDKFSKKLMISRHEVTFYAPYFHNFLNQNHWLKTKWRDYMCDQLKPTIDQFSLTEKVNTQLYCGFFVYRLTILNINLLYVMNVSQPAGSWWKIN